MRDSNRLTRPAPRAALVGVLATFVSFALLPGGVAAASITLFEQPLFHPGSVNGQSGVGGFPWKSSPTGAISCVDWPVATPPTTHTGQYDQAVVANTVAPLGDPPGFGSQSLRMSNACASGEFFYQTYSPRESVQVGEGRVNKVFMAQFSFMSKTPAYQRGLFLSVSPDSGEGSRMSWVGLEDTPEGIRVSAADTPEVDGEFVDYPDLALLDRTQPHTIRFWIKVNPGPDNDLVRIAIDNRDVGQCFTTWENYYRTAPEQAPPPNANTPADINSLQFRSSVPGPPELATSGGYLFDNVSITPQNGPGPPGCDLVIDKEADARTVMAGGLAGYTISARNRGRGSDRNVQVCDRIPRRTRFVSANRKLHRTGRRRCLVIPRLRSGQSVNFHLKVRVNPNTAPGTLANVADITPGVEPPSSPASPGEPPSSPASPGAGDLPRPPVVLGARRAVKRATAVVRVRARPLPPGVTG